jgi:hypothetical protein
VTATRTTTIRRAACLLGAGLLVAACSGSGDGDSAATTITDEATTTSAAATTTVPPTTVAATSTTTETSEVTTTTPEAAPVMPLTGLPIEDQAKANRPALVVKIDNHPDARPQSGLNAADIVFEENVESLTRFAVVFQSNDSDPVGPIRSGRTQDVALLGSLNQPLFAWSGGNPNVTRAIDSSDLIDLSQSRAGSQGGFFRSGDRKAPHNLYAKTSALYTFTPIYAPPPPQQFVYRADGEAFNGVPSLGVDLKMDGVKVNWTWDGDSASYLRKQGGQPHMDADLGQVNAANVVVLEVDYKPSPADARSPEAQTIGTGKVYVFTAGVMIEGTWTRADRLDPFTLTDADGNVIALTPGRTWVELARVDSTTPAV